MKKSSEKSTLIDKLILQIAGYSPTWIVILVAMLVLLLSLPSVYFITKSLGGEYTGLLLLLCVILPLLTPLTLILLLRLTKHSHYSSQNVEEKLREAKEKELRNDS